MLVTITNVSGANQPISMIYKTLASGESVTVERCYSDLDRELQLKQLVVDGLVTLSFAESATDDVEIGYMKITEHSNADRPAASSVPVATMIWNSDDKAPNFSNGTNWIDANGNVT